MEDAASSRKPEIQGSQLAAGGLPGSDAALPSGFTPGFRSGSALMAEGGRLGYSGPIADEWEFEWTWSNKPSGFSSIRSSAVLFLPASNGE